MQIYASTSMTVHKEPTKCSYTPMPTHKHTSIGPYASVVQPGTHTHHKRIEWEALCSHTSANITYASMTQTYVGVGT